MKYCIDLEHKETGWFAVVTTPGVRNRGWVGSISDSPALTDAVLVAAGMIDLHEQKTKEGVRTDGTNSH